MRPLRVLRAGERRRAADLVSAGRHRRRNGSNSSRKGTETTQPMQSVAVGIARDATALLTSRERIELLRVMMLARATEQRARTLVGRDRDAEPAARWRREPIGAGAARAPRRGDRLVAPGRYVAAHLA